MSNIVIVRKKPAEWQGVFIAEVNFTNIFEQLFCTKGSTHILFVLEVQDHIFIRRR